MSAKLVTLGEIARVRYLADKADKDKDINLRLALLDIVIELKWAYEDRREPKLTLNQLRWMGGR